ncbi:MAG: hypothetical protein ACI31S_00280 [Bacilli bacterium]
MEELYNIGLDDENINNIIETNKDILNISSEVIVSLINILKECNCSERIIRNIITSNPFYLNRDIIDIMNLINKLDSMSIRNLDVVFDTNPWLLDKDADDIDSYINESGKEFDDVINEIESGIIF